MPHDKKLVKQLFRFGIIGISKNLVGYIIYLLITYFGIPPKSAMSFLYVIGTVVAYFGNRKFVFAHKGSELKAAIRYFLAYLTGYLINLIILIVMVDILGYAHQWVQILAIFVVAGFLFLSFKIFVFEDAETTSKEIG